MSASDVDACFREYDRDRDNCLNFAEFCVMMNAKHHSAQESKKILVSRILLSKLVLQSAAILNRLDQL